MDISSVLALAAFIANPASSSESSLGKRQLQLRVAKAIWVNMMWSSASSSQQLYATVSATYQGQNLQGQPVSQITCQIGLWPATVEVWPGLGGSCHRQFQCQHLTDQQSQYGLCRPASYAARRPTSKAYSSTHLKLLLLQGHHSGLGLQGRHQGRWGSASATGATVKADVGHSRLLWKGFADSFPVNAWVVNITLRQFLKHVYL